MTDAPVAGEEPTPEPEGVGALLREGVLKLVRAPRLGRRGVRLLVAIFVDRLGRHVDLPGPA